MHSYKDLIEYFGVPLSDPNFQTFIKNEFRDLTDYNVLESNYMSSDKLGIDLGFTNNDAVFDEDDNVVFTQGNPIFSIVNIFPKSSLNELPFDLTFTDVRKQVLEKAGKPTQTRKGEASFLGSAYLVDNYKIGNIVITIDYKPKNESINFIQIRDNNLIDHLKL